MMRGKQHPASTAADLDITSRSNCFSSIYRLADAARGGWRARSGRVRMVELGHTASKEDKPLLDDVSEAGREGALISRFVRSPGPGHCAANSSATSASRASCRTEAWRYV